MKEIKDTERTVTKFSITVTGFQLVNLKITLKKLKLTKSITNSLQSKYKCEIESTCKKCFFVCGIIEHRYEEVYPNKDCEYYKQSI